MSTERTIFHGRVGGTVFIDALRPCRQSKQWRFPESCHLFTLPGWLEDLHAFADRVGLRRVWFQENSTMPHYDLTSGRRKRALALGAVEVSREETVAAIRAWRASNLKCEVAALEEQRLMEFSDPALGTPFPERRKRFLTEEEVHAGFELARGILKGGGR